MNDNCDVLDAVIVGAGPAGLTAAIYLSRFRRRCVVLENGESRARWIPTSHNIPGFTAGIGGDVFLEHLREQAGRFGAPIRRTHVKKLTSLNDCFETFTDTGVFRSRFVLLATGVKDHLPKIDGAEIAMRQSLLRACPICDAFEAIDKRIGVLGDGPHAEHEAEFLTHYSPNVTVLQVQPNCAASRADAFVATNVERIRIDLSDLRLREDHIEVTSPVGERRFDVVYLALGCRPQHELARALGARCDEHGALWVSAHQETSVSGLYAAGDVVRGLNQVVVAAAESAIAATDIHNKLRRIEIHR